MSFPKIITLIFAFALLNCKSPNIRGAVSAEHASFAGTWKLISRIDKDANNASVNEPTLGSDPIAILMYDSLGNVSVQIMKRNRQDSVVATVNQTSNNSRALNGYDAYFGTYQIDTIRKQVIHTIVGSIRNEDVGKQLRRNYVLIGDTLKLSFSTIDGRIPVTRTVTFIREKNSR
jgi:lipocalin-like protein